MAASACAAGEVLELCERMKVDDYTRAAGITRRELARRAGMTEHYLCALVKGTRRWGIESMAAIIRATAGQVGILDMRPDLFPLSTSRSLFARGGTRKRKSR